jgi:hypothetical protein
MSAEEQAPGPKAGQKDFRADSMRDGTYLSLSNTVPNEYSDREPVTGTTNPDKVATTTLKHRHPLAEGDDVSLDEIDPLIVRLMQNMRPSEEEWEKVKYLFLAILGLECRPPDTSARNTLPSISEMIQFKSKLRGRYFRLNKFMAHDLGQFQLNDQASASLFIQSWSPRPRLDTEFWLLPAEAAIYEELLIRHRPYIHGHEEVHEGYRKVDSLCLCSGQVIRLLVSLTSFIMKPVLTISPDTVGSHSQ